MHLYWWIHWINMQKFVSSSKKILSNSSSHRPRPYDAYDANASFSSTLRRTNLKKQILSAILDFLLTKTQAGNSHHLAWHHRFSKILAFNYFFSVHTKNLMRQIPPVWRAFRKALISDGLVWTADLIVETECCVFKFLWRSVDRALMGETIIAS